MNAQGEAVGRKMRGYSGLARVQTKKCPALGEAF
ncbi:hypothetical protein LMG33818_001254 [Halomonadaceae bacterium LMG 33818]